MVGLDRASNRGISTLPYGVGTSPVKSHANFIKKAVSDIINADPGSFKGCIGGVLEKPLEWLSLDNDTFDFGTPLRSYLGQAQDLLAKLHIANNTDLRIMNNHLIVKFVSNLATVAFKGVLNFPISAMSLILSIPENIHAAFEERRQKELKEHYEKVSEECGVMLEKIPTAGTLPAGQVAKKSFELEKLELALGRKLEYLLQAKIRDNKDKILKRLDEIKEMHPRLYWRIANSIIANMDTQSPKTNTKLHENIHDLRQAVSNFDQFLETVLKEPIKLTTTTTSKTSKNEAWTLENKLNDHWEFLNNEINQANKECSKHISSYESKLW